MRFRRKILRNNAKLALKEKGFSRPNKLAYHKEHGVEVEAVGTERMLDIMYNGKKRQARKAKKQKRRRAV